MGSRAGRWEHSTGKAHIRHIDGGDPALGVARALSPPVQPGPPSSRTHTDTAHGPAPLATSARPPTCACAALYRLHSPTLCGQRPVRCLSELMWLGISPPDAAAAAPTASASAALAPARRAARRAAVASAAAASAAGPPPASACSAALSAAAISSSSCPMRRRSTTSRPNHAASALRLRPEAPVPVASCSALDSMALTAGCGIKGRCGSGCVHELGWVGVCWWPGSRGSDGMALRHTPHTWQHAHRRLIAPITLPEVKPCASQPPCPSLAFPSLRTPGHLRHAPHAGTPPPSLSLLAPPYTAPTAPPPAALSPPWPWSAAAAPGPGVGGWVVGGRRGWRRGQWQGERSSTLITKGMRTMHVAMHSAGHRCLLQAFPQLAKAPGPTPTCTHLPPASLWLRSFCPSMPAYPFPPRTAFSSHPPARGR